MDTNQNVGTQTAEGKKKDKKNGKKIVIIIVAIVVALAVIAGVLFAIFGVFNKGGNSSDRVYVEKVANLLGSNMGAASSYSGKVETQETLEIKRDMEKTIAEIYVEEGDEVSVGTPLFSYDTDEIEKKIQTAGLELESYGFTITNLNNQIADMTKLKNEAPADQKLEYAMQIQQLQAELRQAQFDQSAKETEIENLKKSLANAKVLSTMDGVVKSINDTESSDYGDTVFMTILQVGDYRVKGKIDEQSYYRGELYEGQPVIVRSRVDETVTWTGVISLINTEEEAKDNEGNGYYYYDDSMGESTTKYPFYVELDSSEGLILGQHVFIEPDYGQVTVQEGIWLDEGYIEFAEDGKTYIWCADGRDRLERREVELGEFNEMTWQYQVLSGITEDDYIAYYMQGFYEGITCVTNYDEIDYTSPLYNSNMGDIEDGYSEEGAGDEGYYEEGFDDSLYDETMGQIDNPYILSGTPEDYGDLGDLGLNYDEESGLYVDDEGYYYTFDGESIDFGEDMMDSDMTDSDMDAEDMDDVEEEAQ